MTATRVGALLAACGVIVLVVSALADPLGLGGGDSFGWKQAAGVIVGAVASGIGIALVARGRAAADVDS